MEIKIQNALLALIVVGAFISPASAGCLPGMLPGYQVSEFQICGTGAFMAFETGGASLVACLPLAGHFTFNTLANKVCDFLINYPTYDNVEELDGKRLYIDWSRGYSTWDGYHCFYTSGPYEAEIILPPGSEIPYYIDCDKKYLYYSTWSP